MYQELSKVTGVQDVILVKLLTRSGANYSVNSININNNLSPNGTKLIIPKNAVVEIKYPDVDIKGQVR
jgi:hypothetical protein